MDPSSYGITARISMPTWNAKGSSRCEVENSIRCYHDLDMPQGFGMTLICLMCLTTATPTCMCGNAATITDIDGHLHIYVEEIKSTRLANVYYLNGVETYRELLQPFDTQMYVPYTALNSSYLNFQPYAKKNDHVRNSPIGDKKLMDALLKYRHSTASHNRIGSTKKQPNRRLHD